MSSVRTADAGPLDKTLRRYTAAEIVYAGSASLPKRFIDADDYDALASKHDLQGQALFQTSNTAEALAAEVQALKQTVAELGDCLNQKAASSAMRASRDKA